jgi:hypothetical protein
VFGSSFIRPRSWRGWLTRLNAHRRFFGSVSALVVSTSSSYVLGVGDTPAASNRSCRMKW